MARRRLELRREHDRAHERRPEHDDFDRVRARADHDHHDADDSSSAGNTIALTNAGPSTTTSTESAPEPTTTTTTPPTTGTTGTTITSPPKPEPKATLIAWPAGRAGWTIVLDSVPSTNGRAGALGEAKQASRLGLSQVGVLDSAQFSSLHPGYFVVFTGVYGTEAAAQSHIIDAHRRGYREPYPRRIVP